MNIVKAEIKQLGKMMLLGKSFWNQTLYYKQWGIEYDFNTVYAMAHKAITDGVAFNAVVDDKVIGMILIHITPFPMNFNYLSATEWVYYVHPDHRNTKAAMQLMVQAEAALKEKGVKLFSMVSLTNVTPEKANGLYKHLGFKHSETSFTKDIS